MVTPVSAALEADLRSTVRKHGVVVWLDGEARYASLVDRLARTRAEDAARVPFAVLVYRQSYLDLMLQAEDIATGIERTPVVVYLPRFTEERVKASPLLELYRAGVRYWKGFDTLVTEAAAGRVRPDLISAFLDEPDLTLERADAWLTALLDDRASGLAAQLQAMSLPAIVDDLLSPGGFVAGRVTRTKGGGSSDLDVLWEHLEARTGLSAAWRDCVITHRPIHPEDVACAVCSWAMCVEYVHDLGRAPVDRKLAPAVGLPGAVVAECRALASHLRERHPRAYLLWADETESLLADEVAAAVPRDLGRIDTLRFEEDTVLRGALEAMASEPEDWKQALAWAEPRIASLPAGGGRGEEASFWVQRDENRLAAWQVIAAAAKLGLTITVAGPRLAARGGHAEAVTCYVSVGYAVDQAHRHLEQVLAVRKGAAFPERDTLRTRIAEVRECWRTWADQWARDFNDLCRTEGFLPALELQQRTIFDEVVRPFSQERGTAALFMVDALRYEMAEELYRTLVHTPATMVQLRARLAELPTVSEVGMNVLAPVATGGRLRPAVSDGKVLGFSAGEFRVHDPESRRRAMADRVGGATCPLLTLDEVLGRDSTSLKLAVSRANLVVVHSQEIDTAGESRVGPDVFEGVLRKLRAAWQLLRDAGVRRFVITADHGFLLLDETAAETPQPHGARVDPKRRYAYSLVAADHDGEARVPLASLGYEAVTGHLMFPMSTAVFDTGRRDTSFVHGGNSLQERVIPVLTLVHRSAAGGDTQRYEVRAKAAEDVMGTHCIEARIEPIAQETLAFGGVRELDVGLRVLDAQGVHVEICDVRKAARRVAGTIRAKVGADFEVFFKLTGAYDTRVRVEVHHPGAEAEVTACRIETRFEVTPAVGTAAHDANPVTTSDDWLETLPEAGVRRVFAHITAHGAITEAEALTMFPNARALRAFALAFEGYAARAPFEVGIESVDGTKRYVRKENRG